MIWQDTRVQLLSAWSNPEIRLSINGRVHKYFVRHKRGAMPLELQELHDLGESLLQVAYDSVTERPVAVKVRNVVYPLTKSVYGLPGI